MLEALGTDFYPVFSVLLGFGVVETCLGGSFFWRVPFFGLKRLGFSIFRSFFLPVFTGLYLVLLGFVVVLACLRGFSVDFLSRPEFFWLETSSVFHFWS